MNVNNQICDVHIVVAETRRLHRPCPKLGRVRQGQRREHLAPELLAHRTDNLENSQIQWFVLAGKLGCSFCFLAAGLF